MNIDLVPLSFGKYKGMTPEQIADRDPAYIVWLYEHHQPRVCTKSLMLACADEMDEQEEDLEE